MSEETKSRSWVSRPWVWITIGLLVISASVYGGFEYFENPPLGRYTPVLQAMKDHHVTVDDRGQVDLSRQFPGISANDDAYVTWRDDGSFVAMFPTYHGRGTEVAGLMYTSRPLQESDVHYRDVITFQSKLIAVGSYQYLFLGKKINDNWYHVSYKLE